MPDFTPDRIIVISDLHLGPGGGYDFFSAGAALRRFIDAYTAEAASLDLVILGDALDFLQLEPPLKFTKEKAEEKADALIQHNHAIFEGLKAFVARPNKRIVWAIGNHDLELLFPGVQTKIEQALGLSKGDSRLVWELGGGHRDYASAAGIVRLVHGNVTDLWNSVDYARALQIIEGKAAGDPYPRGSRLVAEVLHRLRKDGHGYIDMLKPEASVALPLAIALWPKEARSLLESAIGPFARVSMNKLAFKLRDLFIVNETTLSGGGSPAGQDGGAGPAPGFPSAEELLAATLTMGLPGPAALDETLARWLVEADSGDVAAALDDGGAPVLGADEAPRAAISWLLRALAHRLNMSDTFDLEGDDENDAIVRRTLAAGVKLVVAGHTHLARAIQYQDGFYINTGTWADLMRLPQRLPRELFMEYAKRLKDQFEGPNKASVCRPFQRLTYADIDLINGTWALKQWTPEPSLTLQAFP